MSSSTFCPCNNYECELHPGNHEKGCDLCVEDSVKTREIPKCFFAKAGANLEEANDWSFESFANLVLSEGAKKV